MSAPITAQSLRAAISQAVAQYDAYPTEPWALLHDAADTIEALEARVKTAEQERDNLSQSVGLWVHRYDTLAAEREERCREANKLWIARDKAEAQVATLTAQLAEARAVIGQVIEDAQTRPLMRVHCRAFLAHIAPPEPPQEPTP